MSDTVEIRISPKNNYNIIFYDKCITLTLTKDMVLTKNHIFNYFNFCLSKTNKFYKVTNICSCTFKTNKFYKVINICGCTFNKIDQNENLVPICIKLGQKHKNIKNMGYLEISVDIKRLSEPLQIFKYKQTNIKELDSIAMKISKYFQDELIETLDYSSKIIDMINPLSDMRTIYKYIENNDITDIHLVNFDNNTALIVACKYKMYEVVKILLQKYKKKCNIYHVDNYNKTALSYAYENKLLKIVSMIFSIYLKDKFNRESVSVYDIKILYGISKNLKDQKKSDEYLLRLARLCEVFKQYKLMMDIYNTLIKKTNWIALVRLGTYYRKQTNMDDVYIKYYKNEAYETVDYYSNNEKKLKDRSRQYKQFISTSYKKYKYEYDQMVKYYVMARNLNKPDQKEILTYFIEKIHPSNSQSIITNQIHKEFNDSYHYKEFEHYL